jgi:hypothetical protein
VCVTDCKPYCPPGDFYDPSIKKCRLNCADNQVWNGVTCTCLGGLVSVNGVCQHVCQANAEDIDGTCTCKQGFTFVNGQCILVNCNSNEKWDQNLKMCVLNCSANQ